MIDRVSTYGSAVMDSYWTDSMQVQLNQISGEISSGIKSDAIGPLGANASLLYQLHAQSDQQTALQTTVTDAVQRLDAVQTAMTSIGSTVQNIATQAINSTDTTTDGPTVLASQAQDAMAQVISQLNTQYEGNSLFAGDATTNAPMQAADAAGGPLAAINSVLSAAVSAKGGPLSSSDINNLINGPDGIASIFSDTNSDPALNYNSAFYTAPDDGKPTTVLVGTTQTMQYSVTADQQPFRDLMQGLSMLSLLGAPSSQLDSSAVSALQTQAGDLINQAQSELTTQQGLLGVTQSSLQNVADQQQSAANATQTQILSYEQANTSADSTTLATLQTQLQASYEVTSMISQLTLTHYLPTLTS